MADLKTYKAGYLHMIRSPVANLLTVNRLATGFFLKEGQEKVVKHNFIKKMLAVKMVLALTSSSVFADSIFVATDRHAHYETVAAEGEGAEKPSDVPPLPENKTVSEGERRPMERRPMRERSPVYDENGNLIWHNNLTDIFRLVAADGVVPEYVMLGGDNVGEGGGSSKDDTGYPMGAPFFSVKAVDAQVKAVFGDQTDTLYTYGSHDKNVTEDYQASFFSGPVEGTGYYIYGIAFSQMIHDNDQQAAGYEGKDTEDPYGLSAQSACHMFLSWVRSLNDHLPIVVMSHVPLHAHRGDNLGAWSWTRALNAAAKDHDIIFLWGHNHTIERIEEGREIERANYLRLPGDELTVQSWDLDGEGEPTGRRKMTAEDGNEIYELITQTEELGFIYMNAGYIVNGVGTVIDFSKDHISVKRYALTEEEEMEPLNLNIRQWKE